jgi:amino acid efflux transporter
VRLDHFGTNEVDLPMRPIDAENRPMTTPATTLTRGLSVPQGAALTIGAVLGTGVISLPALAADLAGPASIVAWVLLLALSVPLAATFAALGSRYPDSGGVSTYVRRAFGDHAATAVGWCFYWSIPVGAPVAALFAGNYVADASGGGRDTSYLIGGLLIVLVAAMNWFGLKVSGRAQLGLAGVLAMLLLVTTVAALPHAHWSNLTPFAPHGWSAIGPTAALLVWGFAGWEAVTSLAGEYRNPAHDIPRATGVALVVVGILYLGVVAAALLVLGPAAGTSRAPLADLLAIGFGEPARAVTTVVALLLTLGAMNAYFSGGSKLGAAMGRDGSLPSWFAQGSGAGEIPRRSLAVMLALGLAAHAACYLLHLGLSALVLVITGSFTLVYVLGTAAAVRLLPAGLSRALAVVAFVSVLGLLAVNGVHVVFGVGIALSGLAFAVRRKGSPVVPAMAAETVGC